MENFINKAALVESLGISIRTLENWVAYRGFPSPRHVCGSRLAFFKVTDVEAWMEQMLEKEGLL
jgi:predicted DNA-binding transcriptional regulator AlpA